MCTVDSVEVYSPTTPWQSKHSFSTSHAIINKEDEAKHSNEDANMLNKLPQGFFDEEKIGGRVKLIFGLNYKNNIDQRDSRKEKSNGI